MKATPQIDALPVAPASHPVQTQVQSAAITNTKLKAFASKRTGAKQEKSLIEQLAVPLLTCDRDWTITYSNGAASKLFGRGTLTGGDFFDLCCDLADQKLQAPFREGLREGNSASCEGYLTCLNGWYELEAIPASDGICIFLREITDRIWTARWPSAQRRILESIARGVPLRDALSELATSLEEQQPNSLCAIAVLEPDGEKLSFVVAPGMPAFLSSAVRGITLGPPYFGPCFMAISEAREVTCGDIANDALWLDAPAVQALTRQGFQSCRSIPILDHSSNPLGALTIYRRESAEAGLNDQELLETAIHIASIAIERHNTEEELRQGTERLQSVIESGDLGTWEWTAADEPMRWNAKCKELFGWSSSENPTFSSFQERIHPEDSQRVEGRFQAASQVAVPRFEEEFRVLVPGKPLRWHMMVGSSFYDSSGAVAGMRGVMWDVTERKVSAERLRESEERYRLFVQNSAEAIWRMEFEVPLETIWNEDRQIAHIYRYGYIAECNEAMARMYGYPHAGSMAGMRIEELMPQNDPGNLKYLRRAIRSGYRVEDVESVQTDFNGSVFYVLNNFVGEVRNGKISRAWGTSRDITERKRAEQSMRESEARFRMLADTAPVMIWMADDDGRTTYVNQQTVQFTGKPASEMLGHLVPPEIPDEELESVLETYRDAFDQFAPFQIEHRLARADGELRWIINHGRPRFSPNRTFLGYIGVMLDITDRKNAENALIASEQELRAALSIAEKSREEAEAAGRSKDQFLAVLSHELRTPLTPVLMAVYTIQADPGISPDTVEALQMIRRNIQLEARLIDDLLDITRILRNKVDLHTERVNLHHVLRRALEVCEAEANARQQKLEVRFAAVRNEIQGDAARLQQVFWNLLKNAIKFTPENGRIKLETHNEGDKVIVAVQDTGIGISAEVLPNIFKPFEQGNETIVRQFGGLGLGLTISKATIDAHGGTLSVQSDGPGKGATFTVILETH